MTANPLIDQYAAEVRARLGGQSPAARNVARQIANDIRRDLPEIPDEVIGAVMLRCAALGRNQILANQKTTASALVSALGAGGEQLYHHPRARDEDLAEPTGDEPDCGAP